MPAPEVVRQVLREQVGSHFYKDGTRAAEREPTIEKSKTTKGFIDLVRKVDFAKLPPSDDIDLTSQPVAAFAPLAPALETDYRRILAVEPPVWATDPNDGFFMNVPNFLGIRQFAQLTAIDAVRRFSVGDQEGAARAIAAGLHLREGLRKNPNLVSLMIGIAVDGLLTAQQVRLPASENGLRSVADDTVRQRAELIWQLRIEGWLCLKMADKIAEDAVAGQTTAELLPKWARKIVSEPWFRRECAIAVLNGAEHARIAVSPQTLALPDLGAGLHDAVSKSVPTLMEANITRAAMRLHAVLLLREQAELIRDARARLAAGRPVESHDSVVLPGLRWELTADVEKGTVTTRLVGEPEWIAQHDVTPDDFWSSRWMAVWPGNSIGPHIRRAVSKFRGLSLLFGKTEASGHAPQPAGCRSVRFPIGGGSLVRFGFQNPELKYLNWLSWRIAEGLHLFPHLRDRLISRERRRACPFYDPKSGRSGGGCNRMHTGLSRAARSWPTLRK